MSVSTSAETPVDAIADILDGASATKWTATSPAVFRWWERAEHERGPGQGQPAEIHCWMPTGTDIERLSADGDHFNETGSVECVIYTLSESDAVVYARDTISILSEYMDEQEANTEFVDIQPVSVEDFRETKLSERTDHYTYSVEVETERITDTDRP